MKLSFLVYRQEGITPSCFTIIHANVDCTRIKNSEDLLQSLRHAVTEWAKKTENGQRAYAYAGDDMNIGDLASYDLQEIIKYSPDIVELSIEQTDVADWMYDTSICDFIEEE